MKNLGKRHLQSACLSVFICLPLCAIADQAARQPVLLRTAAQAATEPKFIRQVGRPGSEIEIVGLCADIHRAIERVEPGLRFVGDHRLMPAIRVEAELVSGTLDAGCGFSRTRERDEKLVFVGPPLFFVRYHLAVRSDDDVAVSDWADVLRLGQEGVILTTHGFGAVTRLRQVGGLHVDSGAVDAVTNMRKLLARRGRFYYHREPGLTQSIRDAGLEGKVRILPRVMDVQPFYFAVSKGLGPGAAAMLEQAIAKLSASGELTLLYRKWYEQ